MKNAVVDPPVNKFYLTEESFSEGAQRDSFSVSEEEFFRAAAKRKNGKLDAGRTVRSGYAYDFDSTDQVPFSDFERAAKVKAELGEGKVEGLGNRPAYRMVKRAFDIVFSGLVLICFSWLYLIIALIVKIDDPKGQVFFKQTRIEQVIIWHNFGSCLLNTIKAQLDNGFELVLNKPKCAFGRRGRDSVMSAASLLVAA